MAEGGYRVKIPKNVAKAMKPLPAPDRLALFKAIEALGRNPRPPGHARLKLKDLGEYWVRVRGYRIRYDVDDGRKEVLILAVKPRSEAYRI